MPATGAQPRMRDWSPQRIVDRLQIEEQLYLYCRAIDRIDMALLASVFHPDAIIDKGDGAVPVADFIATVAARHPGVPRASHMVANHLIEFTAADTAFVESWCLAVEQHRGTPAVDRIYRVRYGDSFARGDGGWRIAHRSFVVDHVLNAPVDPALILDMGGRHEGRRDLDDVIERLRRSPPAQP
ncbi:nuclear transport factor 2 family protein [Sphingomonas koreensis]|jgi:ketosteroid isomerase-like protein|nr:SnoaL-like protein [Sphingomonas koreensis]RSU56877.1 nuclear transport factor 2 family protein [Sphingomonas koreensis]RSU65236.1 nuclear transport factor 2 family protein [Sphingomonas koreensis]